MFGCVALVSIPPFTCTVPDTAAVGDVLSCPNSGLLAFSPELFALRLDTLTLDGAGVLHPFVQVTVNDSSAFEIVVGPELNSPVSSSLTFNFIQLPVYVIYVSLCEPQALAAFPSVGGPMDFIACSTTQSVIERFQITVTLIHVDLPPVFTLPSFNISVSGVGTAGVSVWQPLSHFVTNPDPVYPYNVTRYRLVPGQCGRDAISAQDVAAPVSIGTGNGSMYYTVSGGLGNYPSPMSLCVLVIDGGGLFAAADISLWFTSVQQQLSVLSPSVNVTHYSPGVTVVTVGVAYNPGSLVNGNWTVTVPTSGWCNVTYGDSHTIVIQLNSLTLMSASQPSFTVNAVVSTAGLCRVL